MSAAGERHRREELRRRGVYASDTRPELYGYGEPEAFAELGNLLSALAADLDTISDRVNRLSALVRTWGENKARQGGAS